MLTLAEEIGLGGYHLASRVRKAFRRLPQAEQAGVIAMLHQEAGRRRLVYLRDGRQDAIVVFPWPVAALPDQISYIHFVSLTIQNALKRLPEMMRDRRPIDAREAARVISRMESGNALRSLWRRAVSPAVRSERR